MTESIEAWIAKKHPEWKVTGIWHGHSQDGRNQWWVDLADGTQEIVVELRELQHKQELSNV